MKHVKAFLVISISIIVIKVMLDALAKTSDAASGVALAGFVVVLSLIFTTLKDLKRD